MSDTQAAQPAGRGLVTETIAVLGAGGVMGFPIARNIARSGRPVRAWNRSRGKTVPLAAYGTYLARSPRDAASGAGIVITMLADEDSVLRAMNGPDGALRARPGAGSRLKAIVDHLVVAVLEPGAETTALDLPLIEALARRYAETAAEPGDQGFGAPNLIGAPEQD